MTPGSSGFPPGVVRWTGRALLVLAAVTPVSVKLYTPGVDLEVITPVEPLVACCGLGLLALLVRHPKALWKAGLRVARPTVVAAAALVLIAALSASASGMPVVAWKAFTVRAAYTAVLLGLPLLVLQRDTRWLIRALDVHAASFTMVLLWALWVQTGTGFDRAGAGYTAFPFYTDHTVHSAALVFVLSWVIGRTAVLWRSVRSWQRLLLVIWGMVLLFGLWASFCRAAWLSVGVVLVLLPVALLPQRWRVIAAVATLLAMATVLLLLWRSPAGQTIHGNSDDAGVRESLLSITNTSTDASNRERLNRWRCAVRMFKADPWLGTGPGTYQFLYVAHQRPEEMTYLSVREPGSASRIKRTWSLTPDTFVRSNPQTLYDSGGTAHSEYFLALAELGITGFVAWCALLGCVLWCSRRTWWGPMPFHIRVTGLVVGAAMAAYGIHALFNNYLDDAKLAFPFWTMIAVLQLVRSFVPGDRSLSNARQS
ncbi:MAG: hypothetical protein GFGODING_00016 [Flavobacteriales bacterium]|nr:hypothetical protein [Flavobacteriales bacterium]